MPLVTITDLMEKERQEKERHKNRLQEAMKSAAEEAYKSHPNDVDSKKKRENDRVALPTLYTELPFRFNRLSTVDTELVDKGAETSNDQNKIEDIKRTNAPSNSLGRPDSTVNVRIMGEWPRHLNTPSHTKEDTAIAESDSLLG